MQSCAWSWWLGCKSVRHVVWSGELVKNTSMQSHCTVAWLSKGFLFCFVFLSPRAAKPFAISFKCISISTLFINMQRSTVTYSLKHLANHNKQKTVQVTDNCDHVINFNQSLQRFRQCPIHQKKWQYLPAMELTCVKPHVGFSNT